MKIEITTTAAVINKTVDAISDSVNTFESNSVTTEERMSLHSRLNTSSRKHCGPANTWEYTVEGDKRNFQMEIDDEAILMALPLAVKVAKVLSPIYDMGKAMYRMMKNLNEQFAAIGGEFTAKFDEKYARPTKYAVHTIWDDDLDIATVVVVEDDGYGNKTIIESIDCMESVPVEMLHKMFTVAEKRGIESRNSMTERWPEVAWEEISKTEALKKAEEMLDHIRPDVEGTKRAKAAAAAKC